MISFSARRSADHPAHPALGSYVVVAAFIATSSIAAQLRDFVAVGVRYVPATDAGDRRRALEEMRQLRFNSVSMTDAQNESPNALSFIDRVLANAPYSALPDVPDDALKVVAVAGDPRDVNVRAWSAIADGARAIVFDDWAALQKDTDARRVAADFADAITRNIALYASLVPVPAGTDRRRIQICRAGLQACPSATDRNGAIDARFLESADALLLIAMNRSATAQNVTCEFSADVPEAIWRNMITGGSVTFVAGPTGPTYPRTFAPKEVIVLAISKALR